MKFKPKEVIYNFNNTNLKCATASNIQINDEYTNCLIDTGAYTSFISEDYFVKRKLTRTKITNKKRWVTANGLPIEVNGQANLKLKIGTTTCNANFIIAKKLAHDVIIGVDILQANKCIVDYEANLLKCNGSTVDIHTLMPRSTNLIHAINNIEIAPYDNEIMWIPYKHPHKDIYIHSVGKSNVIEMVTAIQEDDTHYGQIPILISNPTPILKKIRRGDVIASASPADIRCEIDSQEKWNNFMMQETGEVEIVNTVSKSNDIYSKPWKPSERLKFTNKNLNKEQIQQLKNLVDEFWMVFSRDDGDIGRVKKEYGVHDIKITNEIPIKQRPYNTPYAKEAIVNESVQKMLQFGIIEPTDSDWASPIVLVKKPDGSERFCVDYRKLNAVTIKDCFPMPSIESKLNKLHGCKFFTSLDCTSGYWQISLSERAKKLVAFVCNKGLFQFNYMPFGLCNAGATFQRVIEKVIRNLSNSSAYIDDILTFSKVFEAHLQHLRVLLEKLKEANIKVKTSKCKIACEDMVFLGYKISNNGISIDESRIQALKSYTRPQKAKQVKQFLGLTGFYRHFIQNYADIADPLNKLMGKNVKFIWTDKCETAFRTLIKALSEKPILAFPDFERQFYLCTDASNTGIGAVLGQRDDYGFEKAIYYSSRALQKSERNYSTIEKELLAIVSAVEKFKYYLYGKKFTIITDHNPLVYLNNVTLSSERLTRWRLKLAEYNFEIVYRKGQANANADALSRIHEDEVKEDLAQKENLIEALMTIPAQTDEIKYSDLDIFQSPLSQAIVHCITADFKENHGISSEINDKYGEISGLNKHKMKVGSCLTRQNTRTVFSLITKRNANNNSSISNFTVCLNNLLNECRRLKIKELAFVKYKCGLDKMDWSQVGELINRLIVKNGIQCTVYSNTRKEVKETKEDMSINKKLARLQAQDEKCEKIIEKLKTGEKVKGFIIEEGVLLKLRIAKNKRLFKQLVVPQTLKEDIFKLCHDNHTGAHLGEKKTWAKLHNRFYWKNAYQETIEYVKSCPVCARIKDPPTTRAYLKPITDFNRPFDKVAVDIMELSRSSSGNKYVVVFTDYLTKWVEAFPLRDTKSETIAKIFVNEIVSRHGAPKELLSDQGANLTSKLIQSVCEYFSIHKIQTSPYNPKCDGLTERFNKTLATMLAAYSDSNQTNWDLYLPLVLFAYRTTPQMTTRNSPFYLLYGRDETLMSDYDLVKQVPYEPSSFIEDLHYGWREAKRIIEENAKRMKETYDKVYQRPPPVYSVGDAVRIKRPQTKVGLKKKLRNDRWSEPVEVTRVLSDQNVEIKLHDKLKVVNTNNIKHKESSRLVKIAGENIRINPTITRSGRISVPRQVEGRKVEHKNNGILFI